MWHVGIDLHRVFVVIAAVHDNGEAMEPVRIACCENESIVNAVRTLGRFRAVIEASGTYRWLYDLLSPHGTVLLAHPLRLRAMIQRRTKTDKLDAQLLANLLRINQIPLSYIPPEPYQRLRDLVRCRVRMGREMAEIKIRLRAILARQNRQAPFRVPFGVRGLAWFRRQDFGPIENMVRDELLARMTHFSQQISTFDRHLTEMAHGFPQTEALVDIHGIALFSALLIVAELGEVERFRTAKQVGAYSGLTSRVHQSGGHCYQGSITRQGSPWLRWILVQAAMKAVRDDAALRNFYTRVRKRSGAKKARVAAARKLAEICWKRLRHWHRTHAEQAA
jgi:transposase